MLQYTRKATILNRISSNIPRKTDKIENEPMLTYCNWSYHKKHHLTQDDLIYILKVFKKDKSPYYIRIFNETSINSIQHFLDNNNISDTQLKNIWNKLSHIRGVRLKKNFWKEYEAIRHIHD